MALMKTTARSCARTSFCRPVERCLEFIGRNKSKCYYYYKVEMWPEQREKNEYNSTISSDLSSVQLIISLHNSDFCVRNPFGCDAIPMQQITIDHCIDLMKF